LSLIYPDRRALSLAGDAPGPKAGGDATNSKPNPSRSRHPKPMSVVKTVKGIQAAHVPGAGGTFRAAVPSVDVFEPGNTAMHKPPVRGAKNATAYGGAGDSLGSAGLRPDPRASTSTADGAGGGKGPSVSKNRALPIESSPSRSTLLGVGSQQGRGGIGALAGDLGGGHWPPGSTLATAGGDNWVERFDHGAAVRRNAEIAMEREARTAERRLAEARRVAKLEAALTESEARLAAVRAEREEEKRKQREAWQAERQRRKDEAKRFAEGGNLKPGQVVLPVTGPRVSSQRKLSVSGGASPAGVKNGEGGGLEGGGEDRDDTAAADKRRDDARAASAAALAAAEAGAEVASPEASRLALFRQQRKLREREARLREEEEARLAREAVAARGLSRAPPDPTGVEPGVPVAVAASLHEWGRVAAHEQAFLMQEKEREIARAKKQRELKEAFERQRPGHGGTPVSNAGARLAARDKKQRLEREAREKREREERKSRAKHYGDVVRGAFAPRVDPVQQAKLRQSVASLDANRAEARRRAARGEAHRSGADARGLTPREVDAPQGFAGASFDSEQHAGGWPGGAGSSGFRGEGDEPWREGVSADSGGVRPDDDVGSRRGSGANGDGSERADGSDSADAPEDAGVPPVARFEHNPLGYGGGGDDQDRDGPAGPEDGGDTPARGRGRSRAASGNSEVDKDGDGEPRRKSIFGRLRENRAASRSRSRAGKGRGDNVGQGGSEADMTGGLGGAVAAMALSSKGGEGGGTGTLE